MMVFSLFKLNKRKGGKMNYSEEYKKWCEREEFDEIINQPNKTPADYKNSIWMLKVSVAVCRLLGIENRNMR